MSELSVRQYLHNDGSGLTWGYDKREADKVIAELEESHKKEVEQLLMEIVEQKSEIERLEILCANYRHDCDNLAISNEQVKRAARTLLKKMNHNKYKRCLAMAHICYKNSIACANYTMPHEKYKHWRRWQTIWSELAEKFKPNSTAQ